MSYSGYHLFLITSGMTTKELQNLVARREVAGTYGEVATREHCRGATQLLNEMK